MALEDYTTYTEDDPNSRLTVGANQITVAGLRRSDTTTWVYDDFSAGYFGDVTDGINFDCQVDTADNSSSIVAFALTNNIAGLNTCAVNDYDSVFLYFNSSAGGTKNIVLQGFGTGGVSDLGTFTLGQKRYLTFTRSGGTATVNIYSDSGRLTLVDTLVIVGSAVTLQYMFGVSNYDLGTAGAMSGSVANLEIVTTSGVSTLSSNILGSAITGSRIIT